MLDFWKKSNALFLSIKCYKSILTAQSYLALVIHCCKGHRCAVNDMPLPCISVLPNSWQLHASMDPSNARTSEVVVCMVWGRLGGGSVGDDLGLDQWILAATLICFLSHFSRLIKPLTSPQMHASKIAGLCLRRPLVIWQPSRKYIEYFCLLLTANLTDSLTNACNTPHQHSC